MGDRHGAPVVAYREQTVEIALGPKGAFEYGNMGTLTRRVPACRPEIRTDCLDQIP